MWDSIVASIAYLILLPILVIFLKSPLLLVFYIIDLPAIIGPVMIKAIQRKEFFKALFQFLVFSYSELSTPYICLKPSGRSIYSKNLY